MKDVLYQTKPRLHFLPSKHFLLSRSPFGADFPSRSNSTRLIDNTFLVCFFKTICLPEFLRRTQFPKGSPKYNWYNLQRGGAQLSQRKNVQVKRQQSVGDPPKEPQKQGLRLSRAAGGWEVARSPSSAKLDGLTLPSDPSKHKRHSKDTAEIRLN